MWHIAACDKSPHVETLFQGRSYGPLFWENRRDLKLGPRDQWELM